MQDKKKAIGNIVFLFLVFALTIYGVFHGEDLGAMMQAIRQADIRWLVPGVILVLFFIWGESIIIWYMMRSFRIYLKKRICFLFSSVGFFFSCITPSATGGQPMQIYYMNKEKIPIPVATVILMIVTITYKLVLVVIGLGVLIFGQGFLHRYLEGILPVFYLGLALNVFCVSFMTLLVFHPVLAERIILTGMDWMEKLHLLKKKQSRRTKFQASMEVYRETAEYLKDHKMVIVNVILITFVQRIALFTVTWMVYLAFRMEGTPMWDVVLLQAVISVSVDMLPLPGGMGISESLFLKIFMSVFASVTLPAMVLSRGLGYYSQLLISALFTVVAQLYYTMRTQRAARGCERLE
ncbi:MAG: flippase-like domain-containing protein [Eubacterium sp.]|nr:flippase-like domain-containing protein [Eubacterium sp.]